MTEMSEMLDTWKKTMKTVGFGQIQIKFVKALKSEMLYLGSFCHAK